MTMTDGQSRREFFQKIPALFAAALGGSVLAFKKDSPLISFSTLGCPDWKFKQIVDFATELHFDGIELRGIMRQMDLTLCPEFSKQNIASTLRLMEDRTLHFVDLGSSAALHFPESPERKKNLDEGKRFIDLAQELKCPYVRVFPNNFPKDQEKKTTMDRIANGLLELGEHAKGSNVAVIMETHGDLTKSEDLETIMKLAENAHVGLLWDITNMWIETKESVFTVYEKLKKYIRHTHIKNAKKIDGKIRYTLLTEGEVPIFDAIDTLDKGGYKGYYSFEWEKLWHPELEAPETAIADYAEAMRKHFQT
jgi:sugar phosphate isomerase/epimerase